MPKLVVSLVTRKQEYQRAQAADAYSAAKRMLVDIEVIFAENSAVIQIEQLSSYVQSPQERRPRAFVVEAVTAEGLERVARATAQAGMGWMLLSSNPPYIAGLRQEFPATPISSVSGSGNHDVGLTQAEQIRALLPRGGRIVYVEGPGGSAPVIERRKGTQEGLREKGIEIIKTLVADWTDAGAERAATLWLRLRSASKPDLIVAQNDSMAMGVHRAILAHQPEWNGVPLIGCDGLPEEGRRFVQERVLAATIVNPTNAGIGVEHMARALSGEPLPPTVTVSVESYPPIEVLTRRH